MQLFTCGVYGHAVALGRLTNEKEHMGQLMSECCLMKTSDQNGFTSPKADDRRFHCPFGFVAWTEKSRRTRARHQESPHDAKHWFDPQTPWGKPTIEGVANE